MLCCLIGCCRDSAAYIDWLILYNLCQILSASLSLPPNSLPPISVSHLSLTSLSPISVSHLCLPPLSHISVSHLSLPSLSPISVFHLSLCSSAPPFLLVKTYSLYFVLLFRPAINESSLLSPVKKRVRETSSPSQTSRPVVVSDSPASVIIISSDSEEDQELSAEGKLHSLSHDSTGSGSGSGSSTDRYRGTSLISYCCAAKPFVHSNTALLIPEPSGRHVGVRSFSPGCMPMKQEPTVRNTMQLPQVSAQHQHRSPPIQQQQQRYLIPNASGMLPAPAHMGFLPTSQSQMHLSAHPLPAHLPTFLQQGTAPFTVAPNQATYLNHTAMIGGLPAASATANMAAVARTTRQPAFPSYIYPSYE